MFLCQARLGGGDSGKSMHICKDLAVEPYPTTIPVTSASADGVDVATVGGAGVVDALMSLSRVLVALTARSLGRLGADVTLSQYRMLVLLASRGPQRSVDLAGELGVQPSTVSRNADRLVKKGLVRRCQRAGGDRRVVWVLLTEDGQNLVGDVMRLRRDGIAHLVASAEIPDPAAMAAGLINIVTAAGETPDPQWWDLWASSTQFDQ